ncbi:hypothetical protein [Lentzea sp. NPDC092896]
MRRLLTVALSFFPVDPPPCGHGQRWLDEGCPRVASSFFPAC